MLAAISTVADRHGRPFADDTLDLAQHCGEGMTIEGVVREGQCANDDATDLGHRHGCLGTKLVFLMCLAFADARNVWLMEAVNFACVGTLLALNAVIKVKRMLVDCAFRTN